MNEVTRTFYQCGVCSMEYRRKEDAEECERRHFIPEKVIDYRFGVSENDWPVIYVKMKSGEVVVYRKSYCFDNEAECRERIAHEDDNRRNYFGRVIE